MKTSSAMLIDAILIATISISTYSIATSNTVGYTEPVRNSEPSTNFHAPSEAPSTLVPVPPPSCDPTLWKHIYNKSRLKVLSPCISVTGTMMDATATRSVRSKDGCRHEADGDSHCWLKLDAGWDKLLAPNNITEQNGNLVFELVCRYPVKQADTISQGVCTNFTQSMPLPAVGSYIKVTGAWVFDSAHKHNEIHPVTSIELLPTPPQATPANHQ